MPTPAPHALLEMKIEPCSRTDQRALIPALEECTRCDPAFSFAVNPESGELIMGGQSELQLDLIVDRLINDHGLKVQVGAPQISYRETIGRRSDVDYRHNRQVRGIREFARVHLLLEPAARGRGNTFLNTPAISIIPQPCVDAIEKAVNNIWESGLVIGAPMTDTTVSLLDAECDGDSFSSPALLAATRAAMKEACEKAGLIILEPVMDVEIECPLNAVGSVLGDINARRGQVRDQGMREDSTVLRADIRLSQLFGYANILSNLTGSKGRYTWSFSHYAEVLRNISGGPDDFPPAVGMRA